MLNNLILGRPLAVIDLETTGTDPQSDRIVEIGVIKLFPDGRVEERCRRINPGVPIPPEATAVHGITDQQVADQPRFEQVAAALIRFLDDCDLCGFNLKRFALRVLISELDRCGRHLRLEGRCIIDPMEIYHERERRDLSSAVRFYCGREHQDSHTASADALAAAEVLDAMLGQYPDLPRRVNELDASFRDERSADFEAKLLRVDDQLIFNFGKYRGRGLAEIALEDPGYLRWILGGSFMADTKELVRAALDRPSRSAGSAA